MKTQLKKSKHFITRTMTQATAVQRRYHAMGAPSTQNVRNPLPMHILVASVLPVLPAPTGWVISETKAVVNGKTYVTKDTTFVQRLLGVDYWQKRGKTVDDVVEDLRAKGYIATRGNVAMTISTMHGDQIQSVKGEHNGKRGKAPNKYFQVQS